VPAAGDLCYREKVDLFADGTNNAIMKNFVIRFDPTVYPINDKWKDNGGGHKLITDICASSEKSSGCSLLSVGGKTKGSEKQRYVYCHYSRQYDSNSIARKAETAAKPKPSGPLRDITFHGDRSNSRGKQGKLMSKRTTTGRPSCVDDTCKVNDVCLTICYCKLY
jgi:hypothetical protein